MTQLQRVTGVCTSIRTDHSKTHVNYRGTDVVSFDASAIVLNTGGWRTATTKVRMNQTSNQFCLGYRVYQEKGNWFVRLSSGRILPFPANRLSIPRQA